jgi:hypothetical protein
LRGEQIRLLRRKRRSFGVRQSVSCLNSATVPGPRPA